MSPPPLASQQEMSVPEKKYLLGDTDREYTEAERSVLAALRQHQISLRGRPKKTRDELMVELEASPVFLSFCKVVEDTPKLRPSVIAKLLKSADALISKEYKAALLESMQRRARRKEDVIEAVRQEAVRKMSQDEDIHFEDENSGGFTKEELRQRLDDAQRSRTAHAAYADASELVGGWTIPESMPPLPPGVKGPPPAPPKEEELFTDAELAKALKMLGKLGPAAAPPRELDAYKEGGSNRNGQPGDGEPPSGSGGVDADLVRAVQLVGKFVGK